MTLNVASLNVRGLKDPSECVCLLGELSNFFVNVTTVQETHFTCVADCRVLEDEFVVFSAFGSHCSAGVSLLVGRSLNAMVNFVFAGDGGRLVVADVAIKCFEFRVSRFMRPIVLTRDAPFPDGWSRSLTFRNG